MKPSSTTLDRLHELLADRAGGEPLGADEERELRDLQSRHAHVDPRSFERAAAALHVAFLGSRLEPLPARLRNALLEDARGLVSASQQPATAGATPARSHPFASPVTWLGWWVAAAAVLLLTLRSGLDSGAVPAPSLEQVQGAPDAVVARWVPTDDPSAADASGDVHWSSELQGGYMRLRGLPENDPGEGQYQLWIFDAERPAEYPVDGGVFDARGTEIVVPIRAKVAVAEPTLFAITYERPGGVVVSTRERLLLTGSPQ